MCGIFGHTGFAPDRLEPSRRALTTLSHRGPDQWGDWHDDRVYLGHRRLSVMDLSEAGRQPMANASGDIVICVNGEIYNYAELKSQLVTSHQFVSCSDSEVVLHGYEEWGIEGLLRKLDGMFAIVIYDRRTGKLYLVRDRFGKKPLFYARRQDAFLSASEIKALFEFDGSLRVFSYEGIKRWICHRGSHAKTTIYAGVFQVTPGSYLEIYGDRGRRHVYYDVLDALDASQCDRAAPDELAGLLECATKKRLMSDVPVGVQLSGGIDSSLVTAFLRQHHKGDLHSFSFGFAGAAGQAISEEPYARWVAERLDGVIHHQYNVESHEVAQAFQDVVWLTDGMLEHPNTIAIHLLSKYMKQHVTVSLTGEGADELFGGYPKFRFVEKVKNRRLLAQMIPCALIHRITSRRLVRYARFAYLNKQYAGNMKVLLESLNHFVSPDTFEKLFGPPRASLFDDVDYDRIAALPPYRQLLVMDHKTYLTSLLDRQDRASMGAAVEARIPFLDRQLVEWAMSLDQEHLFDQTESKRILRQLSMSIFGPQFVRRAKVGFRMPIRQWMGGQGELKPFVDRISDGDFVLRDAMNFPSYQRYLASHCFVHKNLNYADSEKMWLQWFLMVLRAAQDVFDVRSVA